MVLKLWRGTTCLRTIYNVLKVNQDELGVLIVKNLQYRTVHYKTYHHPKEYERFELAAD